MGAQEWHKLQLKDIYAALAGPPLKWAIENFQDVAEGVGVWIFSAITQLVTSACFSCLGIPWRIFRNLQWKPVYCY